MNGTPIILPYNEMYPRIDDEVLVCPGVVIAGDVSIGDQSSIWFNSVIRGDVHSISIGKRTNIQDLSMLHVTTAKYPLMIGSDVTVGHSTVLHGCTVLDCCLIGMGSRVLDRAVVQSYSLVAAGSVVREGFVVPEGTLAAGTPAKIVRELTDAEREAIRQSALHYIDVAMTYRKLLGN